MAVYSVAAPARSFDIGRVVKRTFSVLGADLPTFGLLALIFVAAPFGLLAWFQMSALSATVAVRPMAALGAGLGSLLSLILVWVMTSVAYAAAIKAAAGRMEDRPLGLGEALSAGAPKAPGIMLVNLLTALGVGFALIALLIPGLILAIRWSVAIPARVLEEPSATASLGRSAQLTKGHRWAIFGLLLVTGVVLGVAQLILVGAAAGPAAFIDTHKRQLASSLLTPIMQLFTFPIMSVGFTAVYVELRGGTGSQSTAEVFS
jgi:hypothetical protein